LRAGYFGGGQPLEVVEAFKKAELAGFDDAWLGDHFISWLPEKPFGETWSLLCAAATVTKKIKLGSGVTDPFRRSSALLAQSAATLDQLSQGRAILGLGAGEPMNLVPFGINWERPVSRLKETIHNIIELWNATVDKPYTYSGEFENFREAFLQIKPLKGRLPIYVGGTSIRTRRIAGEMSDGWFAYIHSTQTFREDVQAVYEAALKSGRSKDAIDTAVYFHCSIDKDPDVARKAVVLPASFALILARDKLQRIGYDEGIPEDFSLEKAVINKRLVEELQEMATKISDKAISEVALFGTPDQILGRLEQYAKAGLKHCIISLQGKNRDESFQLFGKEIIPHLQNM
jgi:alkanesulfonate monooxygenase SsuD/methylene tetrahydromethanopterin reductase-like flavin-dependent oxidoreductase (luciferase family)